MQKALILALLLALVPSAAHAGQFEKKVFRDVREPYFEAPQELEVPTDDWCEVDRETFEAIYGPAEPSYDYEAPTYDYETPVYDYEPAVYDYTAPAYDYGPTYAPSDGLTREGGMNHHEGRTETYYSSAVTRHADTDQWTVDEEGFYRDQEGRYVVAASDMEQGTVFEGSKGECVVLDSGCAAGVTDYYVDERWT